jgi:hypothetical protein
VWWLLCGHKENFFGTILKRLHFIKMVVFVSVWPLDADLTEVGDGG